MVLNDPRRLSTIFLNGGVTDIILKNHKIKIVIQGVNNHFERFLIRGSRPFIFLEKLTLPFRKRRKDKIC